MDIVFFGNNKRAEKCLEKLIEEDFHIKGIVLHKEKNRDIEALAAYNSIPVFSPDNPNKEDFLKTLEEMSPEIGVLAGYNHILKNEIIKIPKKGFINLHGGKLPEYRGSSVLNWAIINGEKEGCCTIIQVDEGIDTGDILAEKKFEIKYTDTIADMLEKTYEIFPEMLIDTLKKIELGKIKRIKQDPSKGRYFKKRKESDNHIKWNEMDSKQIYNFTRSQTRPCWGAFSYLDGEKIRIWSAEEFHKSYDAAPGEIVGKNNKGIIAAAKEKSVLIKKVGIRDREFYASDILKIGDILK